MEDNEMTKFSLGDIVKLVNFIGNSYKEGIKEYNIKQALLFSGSKYNISIKERDGYGTPVNYNDIVCEIECSDHRKLTIELIPKSCYQEDFWYVILVKYSYNKTMFKFASAFESKGWNYDLLSLIKARDLYPGGRLLYETQYDISQNGHLTPKETITQALFDNRFQVELERDFTSKINLSQVDAAYIKDLYFNHSIFSSLEFEAILETLNKEKAIKLGVNNIVNLLSDKQKEELASFVETEQFQQTLTNAIKARK